MSSTTLDPMAQLEKAVESLTKPPSHQETNQRAAKRALDHGGGLLAAVKAGAVQDHVNMLNNHTAQVERDRKFTSALLAGASKEELSKVLQEAQEGETDDMGIHVQGDQTYNIFGADAAKILEAMQTQTTTPQPVQPPVATPQAILPENNYVEPDSGSSGVSTLSKVAAVGLIATLAGLGGAVSAKLLTKSDPAPSITQQDILSLQQEIKNLRESKPREWILEPVDPEM